MKKISFCLSLMLFACVFFAFKKDYETTKKNESACNNTITVYALGSGIQLVRVSINGVNHAVNLTNGQSQSFSDPSFYQGATVTVEIACAGGGSNTRMRSISSTYNDCKIYPNYVTTASITETMPCTVLGITASTAAGCP